MNTQTEKKMHTEKEKKNTGGAFTPHVKNVIEVNAKSVSWGHYRLLIPLIECVPIIVEEM